MSFSSLFLADTPFLSHLHALTDLNERNGLVLHPISVVGPKQEKATLALLGKKSEKKMVLLKLDG